LHNTDENYEFLKRYKGLKRVDNYIRNIWAADNAFQMRLKEGRATLEEVEAYTIEKERMKEQLEMCKMVERVVSERARALEDGGKTIDFFIKWKGGLSYEACTWESEC